MRSNNISPGMWTTAWVKMADRQSAIRLTPRRRRLRRPPTICKGEILLCSRGETRPRPPSCVFQVLARHRCASYQTYRDVKRTVRKPMILSASLACRKGGKPCPRQVYDPTSSVFLDHLLLDSASSLGIPGMVGGICRIPSLREL